MRFIKVATKLVVFSLIIAVFAILVLNPIAMAMTMDADSSSLLPPNQESEEKITLTCQYPALKKNFGETFTYELEVGYTGGTEPQFIEFKVDVPEGFIYRVEKSYGGDEISGLTMDPAKFGTEKIKVLLLSFADPGEYTATVEASTGSVSASIELKATVTAKYAIELTTPNSVLNTNVTAGKDNYFTIVVGNTGTADLENINLSSRVRGAPTGWSVKFNPEKVESLPVNSEKEVEVIIKPPEKTISGDYEITIEAKPEKSEFQADDSIDVRVTVLTKTIWGWVGIGIVVIVIVALFAMFMRLGRR
jgi:uncharacterized membrane protein